MAFREKCQSYVAPEEYDLSKTYCLSINPLKQFEDTKNPFGNFKANLGSYLKELLPGDWEFHIERSAKGRLHVHGKIKLENFEDVEELYKGLLKMELDGFMSYKFGDMMTEETIASSDPEEVKYKTWEEYINKQSNYWKQLGKDPIISNNQNFKSINVFIKKVVEKRKPKKVSNDTPTVI